MYCCGHSIANRQHESGSLFFTDKLETEFTSLQNLSQASEWTRQQFNVSAQAGRGTYGKTFLPENVFLLPASQTAPDELHGQRSLALRVGSQITPSNAISAAEVDTRRIDMLWGSYRATMKLSSVGGTCAAFFWYFNDTQEIDMEFLSREFDEKRGLFPVNMVIHSSLSAKAGFDASKTGMFKTVNLKFDPTKGFHEYRFDYLPGRVYFYADGEQLVEMKGDNIPSSGGHIVLQHWSNGNQWWSGGPPSSDAVIFVKSVKAYFNSSNVQTREDWHSRCSNSNLGAERTVCAVSERTPATTSRADHPSHDNMSVRNHERGEENGSHRAHLDKFLRATLVLMVVVYALLMMEPVLELGLDG
ncbi:Concanavalin A-like lectin/glucanase [Metarhizium rileyi]|uniref:Concanavalin A-like lectin/glucanase n=1 Tax=Metarhizium rileyi (strain RCEF 4871) TaxID=1649241 RepID=A0A167F787_METRR|nr:Concanavalin A-like lectin/glucanase [Metarhizium rileyi RCEF 4871]